MSSREIAELTGKTHSNVKRDISAMILQLNYPDRKLQDCPIFDPSELKGHGISIDTYKHCGNVYDVFNLDKRYTELLITGYSVTLRLKVLDRLAELESKQEPQLPQSFAEALQLAADQAKQLELAAPKVEFHDKIVNDDQSFSFTNAAKKIQQRPNKFIKWLRGNGYLCLNNIAKQQYITQGLFATHTGVSDAGHHYTQCRVTSKGLSYFTSKLGDEKL